MEILTAIVLTFFGYIFGSIPFGLLLTKYVANEDIRATGSGNIGATNVFRSGNKWLAIATLLLDGAKGWAAVGLAMLITGGAVNMETGESFPSIAAYLAGFAALLGHMYPIWLNGKGGKGVASYFGALLGFSGGLFLAAILVWLSGFAVKRISSFAALMTTFFIPGWLLVFTDINGLLWGVAAGLLIWWRHRENIHRLYKGEEKPISLKK